MKMKFYDTNNKYNRISLLSKHLSPSTKKAFSKRKLSSSYLSSNQKKSRYHHLKSFKSNSTKKHRNHLSRKDTKEKKLQQDEAAHLTQLRQEAYADLHAQLQHYNDEFIAHMRYMENNKGLPSSSSTGSLCSTNTEESTTMQNLIELFEAGSVKDYSQLIEWESYKNPPTYFECQGEYGDLW